MKKIIAIAAFIFALTGAYAQQHTEIELIRSTYKLEKKAVVADLLKLSNEDAGKFWPIYEKYEAQRSAIGDRKVKLITDYVNDAHKDNVKNADAMVKESAAIQSEEAALRQEFYGIVRDKVSPVVAFKFYQAEDMIATAVKMKLWEELGK